MGSLKPAERITKSPASGSPEAADAKPRRRRGRLAVALLLLTAALGAAGYAWYRERPTSEAEIAHIESLIVAGREEEARALMTEAQTRSRDLDGLRLRIGRAYLRQGLAGPATAMLSKVEPRLMKEERLAIAEYFLVQGDPFSAARFFGAGLQTGLPRTAGLLARYGEALSLSGDGVAAVAAFRESLTLDDSRLNVRMNLAATLANLGRLDESRTEVLAILETDPANARARTLLGALGEPR